MSSNVIAQDLILSTPSRGIPGPTTEFTYLCQTATQNTNHFTTFTVISGTVQSAANFQLHLSKDNFSPFTIVANGATFANGRYTMNFTLPTDTYGTGYRLRVINTSQSTNEPKSLSFGAYYIIHNQQIPVTFSNCSGTSTTISIVNTGDNSSPLFYPYLKYRWTRRVGATDTILTGETTSSITVTTPGEYFVETEYGECTPSFLSRSVLVPIAGGGTNSLQITAENGTTEVCQNPGVVLTLNVAFNPQHIYTWFLNGTAITNAPNSNSYTATQGGNYTASYNNNTCTTNSNNTISLTETSFNASLNVASPYQLAVGSNFDAIVTTDANTPEFSWTLNGAPLSENSNTLNIDALGEYIVQIRQTVGCISTKELTLVVIGPDVSDIPNLISPNGDGINDLFKVPFQYISENNLNLEIYNSSGKQIFITDNYQNNWPQDTNLVFQSNAFFYFKMSKDNQTIKEGILTIIK
ncbi:MAG: hypothetical protein HC854_01510 [Flavobacterium sp.]|nr:hypothetical protein [Flavobacterium sp.]